MTALEWHDREHFSPIAAACRLCGRPAYCRDDQRRPCHKVCAEAEAEHAAPAAASQEVIAA
jgi:hypothetical protein